MSALSMVQKLFPSVTEVKDAEESVAITVTKKDNAMGRKKDSSHCALAEACKRQKIADAAIIGLTSSYLIKGNIATRYLTSVAVGREITSFDRHQDFAEGRGYLLGKVPKSIRIGVKHKGGTHNGSLGKRQRKVHRERTFDVRKTNR